MDYARPLVWRAHPAPSRPTMATFLLPLALLAVFLVFRANPQRRRLTGQQALIAQLAPGDKVVTGGGMIGTLVAIEGERAAVEVAPEVIVEFLLAGILRRADEAADGRADEPALEPAEEHKLATDDAAGFDARPNDPLPAPADDDPTAPHHEET